jgi:metal-sulfur cluster biosynthetic enzyme
MNMIALEIELALERAGIARPTVRTVLSPAWTTDWMSEDGRRQAPDYGIAPPQASKLAPRAVRRTAGGVPQCGSRIPSCCPIRLDLLQGAVALQGLPRTVRLFQVSLRSMSAAPALSPPSPSTTCAAKPPMPVSMTFAIPKELEATTASCPANT